VIQATATEETADRGVERNAAGRRIWHAGTLTYTAWGLVAVFAWLLLGDFAFQLKERGAIPMMQILLRKYEASNFVMGMMVGSLPQVIGMLLGPVIAYKSDRHRGPRGRRIPFLLAATPLTVVGMVGLGFSPVIGPWFADLIGRPEWSRPAILWSFALFWTVFEVASVVCNSLLLALVNDVVPRQLIGRFFGLFRVFSVAAGMVFGALLMGRIDQYYLAMFLGIGAIYGVCFTWMCLRVREPVYPPPQPSTGGPLAATKTYLRESFTRPFYLWYFASVAAAYLAFQPINLFSLYFARSVGITDDWYGKLGAMQLGISLLLSFPFGWLADKFHPIRMVMLALVLHGTAALVAFALVGGPNGFAIAHIGGGALAGLWITAWYALTPALVPKAKFAQYFAAMTVFYSAVQVVGGLGFGELFDRLNSQYRYMFLIAAVFDFFAIALTLVVYRHFKRHGGMTPNYVPPE
jgi:MFS family permease